MGRVFLAHSARGRTVAVKLVQTELAQQAEFRRVSSRRCGPRSGSAGEWTAPVLDADTEAATPWVATGYIAGPSLHASSPRIGPLPERSVRILGHGLAHALQAIHGAGLIHRDLKPSNVLITIDGPRVIDFGIARALETVTDGILTRSGAVVGSPGFMSPEQVRGERVTPASDVFCLGSVLAYAATGRQPFGTGDSGVHARDVPHRPGGARPGGAARGAARSWSPTACGRTRPPGPPWTSCWTRTAGPETALRTAPTSPGCRAASSPSSGGTPYSSWTWRRPADAPAPGVPAPPSAPPGFTGVQAAVPPPPGRAAYGHVVPAGARGAADAPAADQPAAAGGPRHPSGHPPAVPPAMPAAPPVAPVAPAAAAQQTTQPPATPPQAAAAAPGARPRRLPRARCPSRGRRTPPQRRPPGPGGRQADAGRGSGRDTAGPRNRRPRPRRPSGRRRSPPSTPTPRHTPRGPLRPRTRGARRTGRTRRTRWAVRTRAHTHAPAPAREAQQAQAGHHRLSHRRAPWSSRARPSSPTSPPTTTRTRSRTTARRPTRPPPSPRPRTRRHPPATARPRPSRPRRPWVPAATSPTATWAPGKARSWTVTRPPGRSAASSSPRARSARRPSKPSPPPPTPSARARRP